MQVPAKHLLPVPRPDPEVVAMLTSGLTASIALEKVCSVVSFFFFPHFFLVLQYPLHCKGKVYFGNKCYISGKVCSDK